LIPERHPRDQAFQLERHFNEPADLRERHLMTAWIGGQCEPAMRCVNDLMRQEKFLDAKMLQIRFGGGTMGTTPLKPQIGGKGGEVGG
jgi:hypothetical protein